MRRFFFIVSLIFAVTAVAQEWCAVTNEAKPGTRWWWQGSAVDSVGITYQLEAFAKAGIGAVEITPIYGVKGNEANDIPFLSKRWMQMLRWTEQEGARLGIQIDMNNGTGWPFGGPEVTEEDAAKKIIFHRDSDSIRYEIGLTKQKVKRAAPGGEGYVIDHLDKKVVAQYLDKFTRAFETSGVPYPNTFFNDSYEVYNADWTPTFLEEFAKRRGYRLEDHWAAFLDENAPQHPQLLCDYRETMSDMLLENFTDTWRNWAHAHGVKVRNQAHGSPANLLDVYAAVDIPEIEGFGLSDFGIRGLRTDSLTRPNYSDLSMLKYPASVAHFYGKPLVTAETFTWLTEHFRTSLSQCKPDFDLMMTAGVNRCYFHGTTYSPEDEPWPGRLFYASMEMSPINPIWHDAPAFFEYIARVQAWMQYGEPDNDLLVYLPMYDIWSEYPGRLLGLDIHKMDKVAPRFIHAVNSLYAAGYDMDYVSERMIDSIQGVSADGRLISPSGVTYKALVLPEVHRMPERTQARIAELERQGATIIRIEKGNYAEAMAHYPSILPEKMRSEYGLKSIRRKNDTGWHYFISDLQAEDVNAWIPLATPAKGAWWFDAVTGKVQAVPVRQTADGDAEVYLSLRSGESGVLQTTMQAVAAQMPKQEGIAIDMTAYTWTLTPTEMTAFGSLESVQMQGVQPWTSLDSTWQTARGTARYSVEVKLSQKQIKQAAGWVLDLGDVRESASVYVNGKRAGTVFAVPYRVDVTPYLHAGKNTIEIDVTGLPANHIAEMDRRGIIWRKFKDANIANLKGGKISYYGNWDVMPAGLNSIVRLIPLLKNAR